MGTTAPSDPENTLEIHYYTYLILIKEARGEVTAKGEVIPSENLVKSL